MLAKSPRMAKHIASQIKDQDQTSNWNLIKYDVMRKVLMANINTNPDLENYLYESGDKQLVETSANDLSFVFTDVTQKYTITHNTTAFAILGTKQII